jgi:hypothetical protein
VLVEDGLTDLLLAVSTLHGGAVLHHLLELL